MAAVWALSGARAMATGAVLQARPAEGQREPTTVAVSSGPGSALSLRRCELPVPAAGSSAPGSSEGLSLQVDRGGRASATDCACGGRVAVSDWGSTLLHSGLAFPPGLDDPVINRDGGADRELPGATAGAAAVAAGGPLHGGSTEAEAAATGPAGSASAVAGGLGSLALGGP
jgi:hypothetical protein